MTYPSNHEGDFTSFRRYCIDDGVDVAQFMASSYNPVKEELYAPASSTAGSFALISYFDQGGSYSDYGWHLMKTGHGKLMISNSNDYFGEPSLEVPSGYTLYNTGNVTTGDQFVSFQVAIYSPSSQVIVGLINGNGQFVATIAVEESNVFAGENPSALSFVSKVPSASVYPAGWVYISANVFNSSSKTQYSWTMQVFVDGSSSIASNVSVPSAFSYTGIAIGNNGMKDVYFTDIVFTSYEIPIYIPGYNPMEGYGQGSGLLVTLLPAFTTLHANMILYNWSVPETGILSFQINAMNYYGATRSSCKGFFQLGVDIDPNGHIAPWYVEGTNCIAHYFLNSNNPAVQPGFSTPDGSMLSLTIQDQPSNKSIFFQIIDYSAPVGYRYWNASIPYNGTEFYATYTQMEFQPSSSYPINDYYFNGTLYNMSYGNSMSTLQPLNDSYMLPFTLNAPPTWSLTYYNDGISGYQQIG